MRMKRSLAIELKSYPIKKSLTPTTLCGINWWQRILVRNMLMRIIANQIVLTNGLSEIGHGKALTMNKKIEEIAEQCWAIIGQYPFGSRYEIHDELGCVPETIPF